MCCSRFFLSHSGQFDGARVSPSFTPMFHQNRSFYIFLVLYDLIIIIMTYYIYSISYLFLISKIRPSFGELNGINTINSTFTWVFLCSHWLIHQLGNLHHWCCCCCCCCCFCCCFWARRGFWAEKQEILSSVSGVPAMRLAQVLVNGVGINVHVWISVHMVFNIRGYIYIFEIVRHNCAHAS